MYIYSYVPLNFWWLQSPNSFGFAMFPDPSWKKSWSHNSIVATIYFNQILYSSQCQSSKFTAVIINWIWLRLSQDNLFKQLIVATNRSSAYPRIYQIGCYLAEYYFENHSSVVLKSIQNRCSVMFYSRHFERITLSDKILSDTVRFDLKQHWYNCWYIPTISSG